MSSAGDCTVQPLEPFGLAVTPSRPGADLRALETATIHDWVTEHRVVVFRGFAPPAGDALPALGATLGTILEWDFGAVNELRVHDDAKNYLYTSREVPFHWDGAFVGRVPRYILFHCIGAPPPRGGGETLFSDGCRLLDAASEADRASWQRISITYSTEKLAHYGGSFTSKVIASHPITGRPILRFAEPVDDLNPVRLRIEGIPDEEHDAFIAEMGRRLRDPARLHAHAWTPGDVVLADNHALLHGRRAFDTRNAGCRHIRRVNVLA